MVCVQKYISDNLQWCEEETFVEKQFPKLTRDARYFGRFDRSVEMSCHRVALTES